MWFWCTISMFLWKLGFSGPWESQVLNGWTAVKHEDFVAFMNDMRQNHLCADSKFYLKLIKISKWRSRKPYIYQISRQQWCEIKCTQVMRYIYFLRMIIITMRCFQSRIISFFLNWHYFHMRVIFKFLSYVILKILYMYYHRKPKATTKVSGWLSRQSSSKR